MILLQRTKPFSLNGIGITYLATRKPSKANSICLLIDCLAWVNSVHLKYSSGLEVVKLCWPLAHFDQIGLYHHTLGDTNTRSIKYTGRWYDVSRISVSYQEDDAQCPTVLYTYQDETSVIVNNT